MNVAHPALLTGTLSLHPGQRPALTRHGPSGLAARVAVGQPAAALPGLMASLHALCASGHRLAARLALQAALGEHSQPCGADRQALRLIVQREQMLGIAHDWPRLLPAGHRLPPTLPLAGAPLWQPGLPAGEQQTRLPAWLQQHWLGCAPAALLAELTDDPGRCAEAALRWARSAHTPLARLLLQALPPTLALATAERPLRPLPPTQALRLPDSQAPDTGPWCRVRQPQPLPSHTAGQRLIARLIDLLHLAAPDGEAWLHASGETLAPGIGRAWVEVSRGLLAYELQIDTRAVRVSESAQGPHVHTVRALQVLSPTCWNSHASGVLAEALAALPQPACADGQAADATRLALAFDPCLPFAVTSLAPLTSTQESSHA